MNQNSLVLATLVRYEAFIRDTLEYTLERPSYDVNVFNNKKNGIIRELESNTPLKGIIAQNEEKGAAFEKTIRDFHEQVYGDTSTILRAAEDGLRVDHAQHLAIFKGVIPIHEALVNMCIGLVTDCHAKNIDVKDAEPAVKASERFYRAVCMITLSNHLVKLFNDYNAARRESNGQESAASRFIGNDISEVIQLVRTVADNSHITDERYWSTMQNLATLITYYTGRRDLPLGKGMAEVTREVQDSVAAFVREAESQYHAIVDPFMQAFATEVQAQAAAAAAPADPTKTS